MSWLDDPRFQEPSNAPGDWSVVRSTHFWHLRDPPAVKFLVERLTAQVLTRDTLASSDAQDALSYSGTSGAGGHPSTVRLVLEGVYGERKLYKLVSERTAPKRWEDEQPFTAACDHTFAYWCSQLDIASPNEAPSVASREQLQQLIVRSVADEQAESLAVEDPAPVAALQKEVLDGLRAGMMFFTASKEGGSRLTFNGTAFQRSDYGTEPNLNEVYPTEAGMLQCLSSIYDWDANASAYPHRVTQLQMWQYIVRQLRASHD